MKLLSILFKIILFLAFIALALVAIRFFINGGWQEYAQVIQDEGFVGFLKWFFTGFFGSAA